MTNRGIVITIIFPFLLYNHYVFLDIIGVYFLVEVTSTNVPLTPKALLEESCPSGEGQEEVEEMEITWEPGDPACGLTRQLARV